MSTVEVEERQRHLDLVVPSCHAVSTCRILFFIASSPVKGSLQHQPLRSVCTVEHNNAVYDLEKSFLYERYNCQSHFLELTCVFVKWKVASLFTKEGVFREVTTHWRCFLLAFSTWAVLSTQFADDGHWLAIKRWYIVLPFIVNVCDITYLANSRYCFQSLGHRPHGGVSPDDDTDDIYIFEDCLSTYTEFIQGLRWCSSRQMTIGCTRRLGLETITASCTLES
ncbi:hypothetical protein EDB19DRAFT_1202542 [Suillus lakei]|nr:hypothetical protein EDB19DRAFT_1202542 [Suillus lakei]